MSELNDNLLCDLDQNAMHAWLDAEMDEALEQVLAKVDAEFSQAPADLLELAHDEARRQIYHAREVLSLKLQGIINREIERRANAAIK